MRTLIPQSAIRFGIVGIANTFVGLGVIYSTKFFLGFGDVLANATGYGVGIVVSYSLNRRWTFGYSRAVLPSFLRFLGVLAIAYFLNLFTVLAAIRLGTNSYLAQALGVPPYTLFSYLASRYFVFSNRQ